MIIFFVSKSQNICQKKPLATNWLLFLPHIATNFTKYLKIPIFSCIIKERKSLATIRFDTEIFGVRAVKGMREFARFAALAWTALCVFSCFAVPAGAFEDALIARYPLCDTLSESGGAPEMRLYCYDKKGYIGPENAEFFTDAGEGGVFNVPCISLAGVGKSGQGRYAVALPAGLMPRGASELTLSLWYKSGKAADSVKLMAFGNDMTRLEFFLSGIVRCNGSVIARAGSSFCQDGWLHLCFAISGRTVRIYIDGAESKAADPVDASRDLISAINQGGYLGDGAFLEGVLANGGLFSDVRIYKKALGAQEIKALSDGGRNGLLITSADSRCVFDKAASYHVREYSAAAEPGADSLMINVVSQDPGGTLTISGGAQKSGSCPAAVSLPLSAGENRFTLSFVSSNGRRCQYLLTVICPPAAPDASSKPPQAPATPSSGDSSAAAPGGLFSEPFIGCSSTCSNAGGYSPRPGSRVQSGVYAADRSSSNAPGDSGLPERGGGAAVSRRVLTVSGFGRGKLFTALGAPAVLAASCAGVALAGRRKHGFKNKR